AGAAAQRESPEPDAIDQAAGRPDTGEDVLAQGLATDLALRGQAHAGGARGVARHARAAASAARRRHDEDEERRRAMPAHCARRNSMNFSAAGEKCLPWRWMIPIGRRRTSSASCT